MSNNRAVFATEAFIAHYFDEPGADFIDEWLDQIYNDEIAGFVSTATLAEVRYIICHSEGVAIEATDEYVEQVLWTNFEEITPNPRQIAEIKAEYSIALGETFALATAASLDARLIVGADDDWEGPIEDGFDIERFRSEPA